MNSEKPIHNFSYIAIGSGTGAGLQVLFYLVFAAILEPGIYGELSYIIAIAGTVSTVSKFGMNQTVMISNSKKNIIFSSQLNVLALITTSVAAIILLFINVYAAILSLAFSYFVMSQHNLLGLQRYKKHMILAISKGGLMIIIPIILYFQFDIAGILIGMAISYFVCSTDFLRMIKIKIQSFNHIKKNYKVIIHNFGIDASTILSRRIDKLIIAPLMGFTFLGLYQFNLQILFGLEIIPIALHQFLLSEESRGQKHKKIILGIFGFSVLITILVILFSPFIVEQLFPKYSDGITSLQILIVSIIPLTLGAIFSAKLQARESTKVGYSAFARIGTLVILIIILGSNFELIGLSIAVLVSTIAYTTYLSVLYYKTKKG